MIQEGEVFEFEGRNINPKFNRRISGDIHHVDIDITEQLWEILKLIPRGAIITGRVFWTNGDDHKVIEKAEKQLKGEFGPFWQSMCKRGLLHALELREILGCDSGNDTDTKKALYSEFGVDSLSQIHPSDFARFAAANHLSSLLIMAEQVANSETAS